MLVSLDCALCAGYDDLANIQQNPLLQPLQTQEGFFTLIGSHLKRLENEEKEDDKSVKDVNANNNNNNNNNQQSSKSNHVSEDKPSVSKTNKAVSVGFYDVSDVDAILNARQSNTNNNTNNNNNNNDNKKAATYDSLSVNLVFLKKKVCFQINK